MKAQTRLILSMQKQNAINPINARTNAIQKKKETISSVAEIDVAVTKGLLGGHVPANSNGNDLGNLVEEIIELRIVDVVVKIPDVQRDGRHRRICTRSRRVIGGGLRNMRHFYLSFFLFFWKIECGNRLKHN